MKYTKQQTAQKRFALAVVARLGCSTHGDNMDTKEFMAQTAYLLLFCLVLVAIIDVIEIKDMGDKYKALYDGCPCYAGKGIRDIGNYSAAVVLEVCNGTINKSYPYESRARPNTEYWGD